MEPHYALSAAMVTKVVAAASLVVRDHESAAMHVVVRRLCREEVTAAPPVRR
jgi:hypothetical protein